VGGENGPAGLGYNLNDSRAPVSQSELGDGQYYLLQARAFRLGLGYRF
jgi:hypothetical protein